LLGAVAPPLPLVERRPELGASVLRDLLLAVRGVDPQVAAAVVLLDDERDAILRCIHRGRVLGEQLHAVQPERPAQLHDRLRRRALHGLREDLRIDVHVEATILHRDPDEAGFERRRSAQHHRDACQLFVVLLGDRDRKRDGLGRRELPLKQDAIEVLLGVLPIFQIFGSLALAAGWAGPLTSNNTGSCAP
jgi:hypothetical protein